MTLFWTLDRPGLLSAGSSRRPSRGTLGAAGSRPAASAAPPPSAAECPAAGGPQGPGPEPRGGAQEGRIKTSRPPSGTSSTGSSVYSLKDIP